MTQEEILVLMKNNPEKGMKTVMWQYTALVYKTVLHKLSSVCSMEDVEETVSDVFFDFYKNYHRVDLSKGSLSSFFIILAQRRSVDVFRKVIRQKNIENLLSQENETSSELTDTITLQREEREILLNGILELGEPDASIVFRKAFFGETYEEIGNRFGISANAANKRYLRSIQKLRLMMKGENFNV